MSFRDPRTAAELLLSPAKPAKRSIANFGTLKLNFGAVALPGALSTVKDITGTIRRTMGATIAARQELQSLASDLSSTLVDFDAQRHAFTTGRLIASDPMFDVPTTGVPSGRDFFRFSSLNPGQPVPVNFLATINERKSQLQALNARISSTFATPKLGGLTILENTNKTPYPLTADLDLPSIPRLSQGGAAAQADDILKDKRRFTVSGVQVAAGKPKWWSRLLSQAAVVALPTMSPVVGQLFKDRTNAKTWSEPTTPYAAQFPYNKVQQTESGHVIELDDTPGAERVHVFHRAGSFIEFHPNGTVVYKNMRDGYDITMGDKYVKVAGACHIAVDGQATLYAKGNVDVQSDGDINVQAKKDFNVYAENINLRAKKKFKADGTLIDLRYIQLPTGLVPVPLTGGLAPRINIGALVTDFPGSNIKSVLQKMAKSPLDPKLVNVGINLNAKAVKIPAENPLSNPAAYTKKSTKAVAYRARLFDTPDEADNFELYSAHVGLQKTLGDITDDPRDLGGRLTTPAVTVDVPDTKPTIDYLNFNDFKGRFTYANTYVLANTSFVLQDLVDLHLHAELVTPRVPPPPPAAVPFDPTSTLPGGVVPDDPGTVIEVPGGNRLDVVKAVNYDYPGLIRHGGDFVDQVAHRLNRIDQTTKWGRKARNADGSNLNDDVLAYQIDPSDFSKKKMVDIIIDWDGPNPTPVWNVIPVEEEEGNGYWAPPATASKE